MKQKKPPPGATLIARLKERRLQREQGEEEAVVPESAVLDVEAHPADSSATTGENLNISVRESSPVTAMDLLHRTISIDDLRPSTDDYFALTEEIRLAGRFAAVGLIAQGLRLARIHNAEIHREHYGSFEDYCRKEHTMSATYAYRLMRMSEMAEKIAERGLDGVPANLPDPFEVMLSLGHRHLMALLPLSPEKAEEYLVNGIPVEDSAEGATARVPIEKATEKQIRMALKQGSGEIETGPSQKRAESVLVKNLGKLVKMLEECASWLEESPAEFELVKMEKGQSLTKLAGRFRSASEKISSALEESAEDT
ncbi:MAG: hypothetical protein K2W95_36600 [Candidatus Obscuribacterales bacterium]|nr:hypothetical protein [Candidatus Obscuribacterales bacterium]